MKVRDTFMTNEEIFRPVKSIPRNADDAGSYLLSEIIRVQVSQVPGRHYSERSECSVTGGNALGIKALSSICLEGSTSLEVQGSALQAQ